MSVKPRGKGHEAYVTGKDGKRYRRTFDNYSDAIEWEAAAKVALLKGQEPPKTFNTGAWTMQTALDKTYEAVWRGSKAEVTAMKNATIVVKYFGANTSVSAVNTEKVQDFINHLRNDVGNSGGTINRKLAALSRMLKYAYQCERLEKLPYMPRQKESLPHDRYISKAEEDAVLKLLRQWDKHDTADLIIFQLDTGARIGETLKLTGKYCSDDQVIFIDTKNGKDHTIPLTPRLQAIVKERKSRYGDGKIFPGITYNTIRHDFQNVCEVAGLVDKPSIHVLRHTFGSRLVQKGVSIQTVSKLMNHSSIQVTMRYAKLAPSNLTDAISVLSE